MYFLTCLSIMMLFSFYMFLLLRFTSPLPLAGLFFGLVVLNTVSSFILSTDFVPYMLYLIYVGGLLVLIVYMVIISTNYQFTKLISNSYITLMIVSMFMLFLTYYTYFPSFIVFSKNLSSIGSLELSSSALVLLVVFLLFSFMYICESLRVGGRSLKVSTEKY